MTNLERLNKLPASDFTATLGDIFEHSPWIVEGVTDQRPFEAVEALYEAMVAVLDAASEEKKVALIAAHPDLAGKLAVSGELTDFSTEEQKSARLDQLTPEEFEHISTLNTRYRDRFGFPFVICVKEHTQASIFSYFEERVNNERAVEIKEALSQIKRIAWHRLQATLIEG